MEHTEYIRFTENDAWILWMIPRAGTDLEGMLHGYVFCARDAIPSYDKVSACIKHAIHAGILIPPKDNCFSLTPEWFSRLHHLDTKYACPEDGLIEFEESFVSKTWPIIDQTEFMLSKDDYDHAAKKVDQYYKKMFDKWKRKHWKT